MKKLFVLLLILSVVFLPSSYAFSKKNYHGKGTVVSTTPVYNSITIKHGAIKGFSQSDTTDFTVSSKKLLEGISTNDTVSFSITDDSGDVRIDELEKTGVAEPEQKGFAIGQAASDVLKATSETAQFVTSPIPPAQGLVKDTVGAAAESTGEAVKDARGPETKSNF